jgi:hypothetical protein
VASDFGFHPVDETDAAKLARQVDLSATRDSRTSDDFAIPASGLPEVFNAAAQQQNNDAMATAQQTMNQHNDEFNRSTLLVPDLPRLPPLPEMCGNNVRSNVVRLRGRELFVANWFALSEHLLNFSGRARAQRWAKKASEAFIHKLCELRMRFLFRVTRHSAFVTISINTSQCFPYGAHNLLETRQFRPQLGEFFRLFREVILQATNPMP